MNFISITQYFNKLHSALFALMIVPLLLFIALYFLLPEMPPVPRTEYFILREYCIMIVSAVLVAWLMATIIFNKKIKSARNEQGLGAKLDKYFQITIVRYRLLSTASLLMAFGLYLTRSDIFSGLYLAGLIVSAVLWPTGRKVTHDLRLKGDEREMVYFKKDAF